VISRALILAAGRGARIGDHEGPNCLGSVGGITLIERTLGVLAAAGVREVAVTLGYEGERLRRFLGESALPGRLGLTLTLFDNPHWDKPNGLSVQAARPFIAGRGEERTLLVMADQIAAPALVTSLARVAATGPRTLLCVDRDLARVFDIDDATKVKLRGNDVVAIGKALTSPDAVSTGLFVMSPTLLDALDRLPEPSLTQGVHAAAAAGLVEVRDVGTELWQDVDSPQMKLHAEWLLRVYGDDLANPQVQAAPPSTAEDTLALVERLMAEKDQPGYVLLNPGPVMTSARVKAALVHHDVCHRDEDYSGIVRRLQDKLRPLFGASPEHEVLLLTGSGTAAMEMALASVVPGGTKLLVVTNGAFGDRLGEIAALHGIEIVTVRYRWGELPRPADVAAALDANPDISTVAMIQHETSVGLLNPVGAVGALCRGRGVTLVVDAVSALGAEDVDVQRDGVGVCFSSANKCLHSVSGVSFLCVAPEAWTRMQAIPPRVYYLDPLRYRRYQRDLWQTPFTPAVSTFFALETALDELREQGGVPARRETYRKRSLRLRRVFTDLGFESFTNTGRESLTISTLRLPEFLAVGEFYDRLKERGFVIYKAKAELAERYVQIANMGELPDATIDAFLAAVTAVVEAARERARAPGATVNPDARAS
jgi:2-aminoethylphosphonate-pyruvate transaminase